MSKPHYKIEEIGSFEYSVKILNLNTYNEELWFDFPVIISDGTEIDAIYVFNGFVLVQTEKYYYFSNSIKNSESYIEEKDENICKTINRRVATLIDLDPLNEDFLRNYDSCGKHGYNEAYFSLGNDRIFVMTIRGVEHVYDLPNDSVNGFYIFNSVPNASYDSLMLYSHVHNIIIHDGSLIHVDASITIIDNPISGDYIPCGSIIRNFGEFGEHWPIKIKSTGFLVFGPCAEPGVHDLVDLIRGDGAEFPDETTTWRLYADEDGTIEYEMLPQPQPQASELSSNLIEDPGTQHAEYVESEDEDIPQLPPGFD